MTIEQDLLNRIKEIVKECEEVQTDRGESDYTKESAIRTAYKNIKEELGL